MISKEIIARQTTAVDAVSGATNSSRAVTAAVEAALQKAGGTAADLKKTHQTDAALPTNNSTDVLVVGAGGAGMLLIEKLPLVGGTTLLASTAFNAGGSKVQMSSAKPYTAADYYAKLEKGARGQELANVKQLADLSGPTADWLIGMGADLSRVINGSQHTPKDGGALGTSLVPVMKARVDALGIETRTDTKATDLIVGTDGRVSGVRVTTPKGSYEIHAKAVILAAGGFASNPDLVKRFSPQWAGYPSTASVGATGDGIIMATKIGAATTGMNYVQVYPLATPGTGALQGRARKMSGLDDVIDVNAQGLRFVKEDARRDEFVAAIKKQPGGMCWDINDSSIVQPVNSFAENVETLVKLGRIYKADTLADLAKQLGMPPANLEKTVAEFNAMVDAKEDTQFGRKLFDRKIEKAPFYATPRAPSIHHTMGGLLINPKAQVLDINGRITQTPGD